MSITNMRATNYKHLVAGTASICTIIQFLAGVLVCQKIVQKKSTGDTSCLPFLCGFASTTSWLLYGFLIDDNSIMMVNMVGSSLHLAYVVVFVIYTIKKSLVLKQLVVCCVMLISMIGYAQHQSDLSISVQRIGTFCCILTVVFCAAPLTSFLHVIKVKSAECLPFPMILMTFMTTGQWFIYGVIRADAFIQIPNFLGCVLSTFQLLLFCKYPTAKAEHYSPVHNF